MGFKCFINIFHFCFTDKRLNLAHVPSSFDISPHSATSDCHWCHQNKISQEGKDCLRIIVCSFQYLISTLCRTPNILHDTEPKLQQALGPQGKIYITFRNLTIHQRNLHDSIVLFAAVHFLQFSKCYIGQFCTEIETPWTGNLSKRGEKNPNPKPKP